MKAAAEACMTDLKTRFSELFLSEKAIQVNFRICWCKSYMNLSCLHIKMTLGQHATGRVWNLLPARGLEFLLHGESGICCKIRVLRFYIGPFILPE